jgi:hypothetical protein
MSAMILLAPMPDRFRNRSFRKFLKHSRIAESLSTKKFGAELTSIRTTSARAGLREDVSRNMRIERLNAMRASVLQKNIRKMRARSKKFVLGIGMNENACRKEIIAGGTE